MNLDMFFATGDRFVTSSQYVRFVSNNVGSKSAVRSCPVSFLVGAALLPENVGFFLCWKQICCEKLSVSSSCWKQVCCQRMSGFFLYWKQLCCEQLSGFFFLEAGLLPENVSYPSILKWKQSAGTSCPVSFLGSRSAARQCWVCFCVASKPVTRCPVSVLVGSSSAARKCRDFPCWEQICCENLFGFIPCWKHVCCQNMSGFYVGSKPAVRSCPVSFLVGSRRAARKSGVY